MRRDRVPGSLAEARRLVGYNEQILARSTSSQRRHRAERMLLKWRTGPPCICGCGRRCGHHRNRYATPACVPKADRAAWASAGRRRSLFKFRVQKFRAEIRQLQQHGGRITADDLLVAFTRIYDRGYHAGLYHRRRTAA